ncbi:MAG: oligosaccharide repeat unit polymerase [Planctomycetes bacterium]|nr:oligosaccharide repeat unit polymerase [Planctomycetota bacterium]
METLLGISAIVTTAMLLLFVANGVFRREHDLMSYRTFFVVGFCFFYGLATVFVAFMEQAGFIYIPTGEGYLPLAICTPLFAIVYMVSDRFGGKLSVAQRIIPKLDIPPTTASLFLGIALCEIVAIIALTPLGDYFTALLAQVRPGLAACAAGLATYYLVSSKFNPIAWMIFLGVFTLSLLICVSGGTDRRFALSVFMVTAWVWYYFDLRYRSMANIVGKMAVAGGVVVFFLIFYSGFRNVSKDEWSFANRVEQFKTASTGPSVIRDDAVRSVLFQDAPINTLYIMENYPSTQALDPFNGLIFFVTNPIPRFLWENKPIALGVNLQQQFGINANLGPGIIGHGWSEGLWIGVAGYALFFGLLCGIIDRALKNNAANPFFMSVFGSSLGNVIGLPRGETSLFLVLWFSTTVASAMILGGMGMVMNPVFRSLPIVMPERVRNWLLGAEVEGADHEHDYGTTSDDSLQDPQVAQAYMEDAPRG